MIEILPTGLVWWQARRDEFLVRVWLAQIVLRKYLPEESFRVSCQQKKRPRRCWCPRNSQIATITEDLVRWQKSLESAYTWAYL